MTLTEGTRESPAKDFIAVINRRTVSVVGERGVQRDRE